MREAFSPIATGSAPAAATPAQRPGGRPSARPALDACVAQLARAVQRVHAYPLGNDLTASALDRAHRALAALEHDLLMLRVSPHALLVDEAPLSPMSAITDLARRLHKASIGSLTIARTASARDLGVFCRELVRQDVVTADVMPLPDVLHERGVEKIQVTMLERPAVLDVSLSAVLPDPATLAVDRARRDGSQERAGHLYPPGKGWVRFDPGTTAVTGVSLADLAQLVGNPFSLAGMLTELAGEAPPADPADALESRFEEIAMLLRENGGPRAERLLAGLARAVLSLDPDRRRALLRNTVMPGLLEGRLDGAVLRQLPDVDLADAIALLLDVQVAAPELMAMAVERLELPEARQARIQPLIEEHLRTRQADEQAAPGAIDGFADGQIQVDLSRSKEFRDFSAFDLAIDDGTEQALAETRAIIGSSDPARQRLQCLLDLLRLEANPETAEPLVTSVRRELAALGAAARHGEIVEWLCLLRRLQRAADQERPGMSELLDARLSEMAGESLAAAVVDDAARIGHEALLADVVDALGAAIVPACVRVLEGDAARPVHQAIVKALSAHAAGLVPALSAHLQHPCAPVVRELVAVLGHAGAGAESVLAGVLDHGDEHVVREAYRALTALGTRGALRCVAERLGRPGSTGSMADVAFWRFPREVAGAEAVRLLGDEAFVAARPRAARTLLTRAAANGVEGLAAPARRLARLRAHVWSPSRMALGWTAARTGGGAR